MKYNLSEKIKSKAIDLGFDRVGIAWVRASDEKAFVSCAAWSGSAFSWAAGSQLN